MRCPGQNTQYWKPDDIFEIECPKCTYKIEFFKDETVQKCKNCGASLLNPKLDFGCASYCKYSEQCLGTMPSELFSKKRDLLKDRIAIEMKHYFNRDFRRIGHASKVARYAERIAKNEKADMAVVMIAAYLHDIGIKEAELQYNSTAPYYQEELGPPIARQILKKVNADGTLIQEVCDIIGHHHHPRTEETKNFKVLHDADLIVNIEEKNAELPLGTGKITNIINKSFLTKTGQKIAKEIFRVNGNL